MKTRQNSKAIAKTVRMALVAALWTGFAAVAQAEELTVASLTQPEPVATKSWAKRVFGRLEWSEVLKGYESPREICRLVEQNIRYKTEETDQWSKGEETWVRGRGDCEDFAVMIQELCALSGMQTKVHLYFPATGGKEGHAVLVGEWNGKVWFSSNGEYEEVKSEDDVRRRVARMLSCKEKQLWVMKLNETDVANYMSKAPARAVAAR